MKFKKVLALLLALSMVLCLCACKQEDPNRDPIEGKEIKDGAGRIVEIPKDPSSATAASVYAVAAPFFTALKISDRVKAINVKRPFIKNADPGYAGVGTVGNGVVDLEKLAKYNPTVLVHRSNDPDTVEKVTDLKIDVICITVESMDDVKTTLRMLGQYFGASERAEVVCKWVDDKFALIDAIVEKIPENEKKTALVLGSELGRVAGNDMFQTWMIEKAGGIAVVDQGKDHNWITVGAETVCTYNPEFIFSSGSTSKDFDETDIEAQYSAVTAYKDGHIYNIPCKQDPWDMPGVNAVLGTMYMLNKMYPSYFSEEELLNEVDEYYEFMFGTTFDLEELGYEE